VLYFSAGPGGIRPRMIVIRFTAHLDQYKRENSLSHEPAQNMGYLGLATDTKLRGRTSKRRRLDNLVDARPKLLSNQGAIEFGLEDFHVFSGID
jgi:hypothetical protein